jgi:hypothetical protein
MRLARWEHVNLEAALWTIPAENAKELVIPLPPLVVE